jgi:hypothetical protein
MKKVTRKKKAKRALKFSDAELLGTLVAHSMCGRSGQPELDALVARVMQQATLALETAQFRLWQTLNRPAFQVVER